MSVCAMRSQSFDVNKLCHCFVRPLSPKQHIISTLPAGTLFFSVCFCACASTIHVWIHIFVCLCAYGSACNVCVQYGYVTYTIIVCFRSNCHLSYACRRLPSVVKAAWLTAKPNCTISRGWVAIALDGAYEGERNKLWLPENKAIDGEAPRGDTLVALSSTEIR